MPARTPAFREVVATGPHSQVVVMSIPPDGEIGLETHTELDQVLVIVEGTGSVDPRRRAARRRARAA